jgi:aminomethyltransferase
MKESPLNSIHQLFSPRYASFAGWNMPIQFKGIQEEHFAVRQSAGIFDISHMGKLLLSGDDVSTFLNHTLSNNIEKLNDGQGQYSLLLNEQGGVIDDLIVYRLSVNEYFMIINAARIDEDLAQLHHIQQQQPYHITIQNHSDDLVGVAIQGIQADTILSSLGLPTLARNEIRKITWQQEDCYICGTGYTGEPGYELFWAQANTPQYLNMVKAVQEVGGMPCGLGARDTLRLEMGYPLYGNDLNEKITPLEAGLGYFVDLTKSDFVGKLALVNQKQLGLPQKLFGIKLIDKGPIPRAGYPVLFQNNEIGHLCSGGLSPMLQKGIAMAYLPTSLNLKSGSSIEVKIRNQSYLAEICSKPFYRHP